jgi:hypothetical protein
LFCCSILARFLAKRKKRALKKTAVRDLTPTRDIGSRPIDRQIRVQILFVLELLCQVQSLIDLLYALDFRRDFVQVSDALLRVVVKFLCRT